MVAGRGLVGYLIAASSSERLAVALWGAWGACDWLWQIVRFLTYETLAIRWHVAEVVLYDEHLHDVVLRVEQSLWGERKSRLEWWLWLVRCLKFMEKEDARDWTAVHGDSLNLELSNGFSEFVNRVPDKVLGEVCWSLLKFLVRTSSFGNKAPSTAMYLKFQRD